MKKLILLLLIAGISYAQSGNPFKDSLEVHRTVLDSLGTQVSNLGLTTGMTMTGNIILEDDVKLKLGDSGADGQLFSDGTESFLQSLSKNLKINATGAYNIYLGTGATYDWQLDADGNFFPTVNQTYDIGDATHEVDSIYVQDLEVSNSIVIGDANITETELEILDGATVTTSELNILDGVTATYSELNVLDGITSTVAELNYTDGVTSNIQTQLDAKLTSASLTDSIEADTRFFGASVVYPTDAENVVLFRAPYEIEIDSVHAVLSGTASCSTKVNIQWGDSRTSADSELFYGDQWVSSTTGTSMTGDTYSTVIYQGEWVWFKTSDLVGTVYDVNLTVTYHKR